MGLPILTYRTQVQTIEVNDVHEGRVTVSGTGLYVVPAGKKALVNMITGLQDAVGSDARAAIGVQFSGGFIPLSVFVTAAAGANFVSWTGRMGLPAGAIITNLGDSGGTNHTWDMTASVKEFNA